jgi:hypothetical protein
MELSFESAASGLVGLLLFGAMLKRAFDGYIEARKNIGSTNPMVAGYSIGWDRDQQERVLQVMERIAVGVERHAKAAEELVSQQTHDMQEHLEFLVKKAEEVHVLPLPVRRRRRKVKPKINP